MLKLEILDLSAPFFYFFGIFRIFFPNMIRVMVFTFGMLSEKILKFRKIPINTNNNQALKSKILDISDTHLSARRYGKFNNRTVLLVMLVGI